MLPQYLAMGAISLMLSWLKQGDFLPHLLFSMKGVNKTTQIDGRVGKLSAQKIVYSSEICL